MNLGINSFWQNLKTLFFLLMKNEKSLLALFWKQALNFSKGGRESCKYVDQEIEEFFDFGVHERGIDSVVELFVCED